MTTREEKINLLEGKLNALVKTIEKKTKKPISIAGVVLSTMFFLFVVGGYLIIWGPIILIPILVLSTVAVIVLKTTGIIEGKHPLTSIAVVISLIALCVFVAGILLDVSIPGAIILLLVIGIITGAWRFHENAAKSQ